MRAENASWPYNAPGRDDPDWSADDRGRRQLAAERRLPRLAIRRGPPQLASQRRPGLDRGRRQLAAERRLPRLAIRRGPPQLASQRRPGLATCRRRILPARTGTGCRTASRPSLTDGAAASADGTGAGSR
jgi:hypothetical protein